MIIDITAKPTGHGWLVHMDALTVGFSSLEAATAFVGQLRARIDAPHPWPTSPGQTEAPLGQSATDPLRLPGRGLALAC